MTALLPPSTKPRLFLWGSCDLHESVDIDVIRQHFAIDINDYRLENQHSLEFSLGYGPMTTSLISLYTPPSLIAYRVRSTLLEQPKLSNHHYVANREICKFPYLQFLKNNATNKDIFILSFSTEAYTKIFANSERFTMLSLMNHIAHKLDPLHWLYEEYFTRSEYQMPFDNPCNINESNAMLQDFARDIYEIFGDRIICVKTHLSNFGYHNSKVINYPVSCDRNIPFYKTSKLALHDNDHTYFQKQADFIIRKFLIYYKAEVPIVEMKEPVFLDLNHKWGVAPFHLHQFSTYKIGLEIYKKLLKYK